MPTPKQVAKCYERMCKWAKKWLAIAYDPGFNFAYQGKHDLHKKTLLKVGTRKAEIDDEILPLIEQLWRLGLDTSGSCHKFTDDLAYVQFPLTNYADAFCQVLSHVLKQVAPEVGYIRETSHPEFDIPGTGMKVIPTMTAVRFDSKLIPILTDAFKQIQNIPGL